MNTVEMPTNQRKERPPKDVPKNREVDKAAAKMAEKNAVPDPPAKEISFEQMQEYFALLTPEMWSHVIVYVYRIRPRIIRQLKDPALPNYIDCLSQPFTMEYMTHHHGGGKYLFEVNDTARHKRGESNHLFRCRLEIDEVRHEPKLNYEELDINNRENMSYIQLLQHRGLLDGKGQVMNNNNQQGGPSGLNADVIKEILGFVSKLNADQQAALRSRLSTDGEDALSKSVGNILLEKMKQDDPTKQVQMLGGLLTALKDIVGTTKPTDNTSVFDRLITMQADHNKTLLQLMKESRPVATEGTTHNFLDDVDKIFNVVDRLQGLRGGGGGSRSGWDVGLDYVKELGLPALQTLNNFLALRNGHPATPVTGSPAAVAGARPGAAFDPYRDQSALRAHAAAINAQAPGAPPIAAPGNELMAVVQAYGSLVVNALNNGTPGYDFADYLCGLMGTGTHAMLSAQGEQALVTTAMQIPELAMFGEARLRTFCDQFIHYEKFLAEAETAETAEVK